MINTKKLRSATLGKTTYANALGCSGTKDDVVRVRWEAIAALNELSNVIADKLQAG